MPEVLRTVIFVDGQNFRRNLQSFAFQSESGRPPYRLDEKHFLWQDFFTGITRWFSDHTGVPHRLLRAYWYNAELITPFQAHPGAVRRALSQCTEQHPELDEGTLVELAREWHRGEENRFLRARSVVLEDIQRRTDFLEFRFVGQYGVNPFEVYSITAVGDGSYEYKGTRVGEKGVDVGIAVDMIAKMPNYDVAILVSGDADFIPLARYVKDNLKQVYQFSIAKGVPPRITYLSDWLKGVVDTFGYFDEIELLTRYLDRRAAIPPAILSVINEHVAALQAPTA